MAHTDPPSESSSDRTPPEEQETTELPPNEPAAEPAPASSNPNADSDDADSETAIANFLDKQKFMLTYKGVVKDSEHLTSVLSTTLPKPVSSLELRVLRKHVKLSKKYSFSLPSGEPIPDSTLLEHYIAITPPNLKTLTDHHTLPASTPFKSIPALTLFYKKHRTNGLDADSEDAAAEWKARKQWVVDNMATSTDLSDYASNRGRGAVPLEQADLKRIVSGLEDLSPFVAVPTKMKFVHPGDMTDRQWRMVMVDNSLLHGIVVTKDGAKYARQPAFKLKKGFEERQDEAPMYRIQDSSEIKITEISSEHHEQLLKFGFQDTSVAVSLSVKLYSAVGADASFGVDLSSEETKGHSSASSASKLDATYHFPRVELFLDQYSLELTEECKKRLDAMNEMLEKILVLKREKEKRENLKLFEDSISCNPHLETYEGRSPQTDETSRMEQLKIERLEIQFRSQFVDFGNDYGHIFATHRILGGKLSFQKELSANASTDLAAAKNSMRIAASLSFSVNASPTVSVAGGGSFSHTSGSSTESTSSDNTLNEAITWEATGGDTTLASNPAAWTPTVKDFHNWRPLKLKEPVHILALAAKIEPTRYSLFERIL